MEIAEFNERKALLKTRMDAVSANGSDENLGELFIAASLHGLVFMDCDKDDGWMPMPICSFFVYWDNTFAGHKSLYLFPADQPIPE